MTDDISNIETGSSCYVVNNSTTIYSYKNNTRTTYIQIGGKWFKNATQTYTNIPTNTVCWVYNDIKSLSSNSQFFPMYEFIALCLAIFVWYIVFKLISRLIKWKQ